MEIIDELDKKILTIITRNARIPFKDVAEQCGVSRAAIHQRVQRMFDVGVIVGSGYQVNPKMLGYNLCVYVGLTLERGHMYRQSIRELYSREIPCVLPGLYHISQMFLGRGSEPYLMTLPREEESQSRAPAPRADHCCLLHHLSSLFLNIFMLSS